MHEIAETKKLAGIPIAVPFYYGWFIVRDQPFQNLSFRMTDKLAI
jgi:hypothetical protein